MKFYEIMLIIRTDIEAEEQQETLSGLENTIAKQGGSVSASLDWHKRRLAYEIDKHREGHYYLIYFSGQGTMIPELEHYFRVTDAVMRYMISAVEEADFAAAVEKAAAAAQAPVEEQESVEEPAGSEETSEATEPEATEPEAAGSEEAEEPAAEAAEAFEEAGEEQAKPAE